MMDFLRVFAFNLHVNQRSYKCIDQFISVLKPYKALEITPLYDGYESQNSFPYKSLNRSIYDW